MASKFMLSGRHMSFSRRMAVSCQRARRPTRCFSSEQKPPKPGWRDPGTFSIWLGWSIVALLCIDQGLQYQQSKSKQEFLKDLRNYRDPPDDADKYEWTNKDALYTRVIRRVPEMDGYKSLRNVKVGDVVDVVEERAGPEDEYSVCRIISDNGEISVGWFPTVDLEEVTIAEKKKPWYKIW